MMKVYRMNECDTVLHNSFDEAVAYYDGITGVFEESKDHETGEEYEIASYQVYVNEPGDEPQKMTVKKGLESGLVELPTIFSSEGY